MIFQDGIHCSCQNHEHVRFPHIFLSCISYAQGLQGDDPRYLKIAATLGVQVGASSSNLHLRAEVRR